VSETDRDSLAEALCLADDTMHHHDATDDFPCWHCRHKADALLASDWLAQVKATARAVVDLRDAIAAVAGSLTRWNGDDGSLVVDANIRHLRRALDGDA
jgi:hypothetical protein